MYIRPLLLLLSACLIAARARAAEPTDAANAEFREAAALTPDAARGAQLFTVCSACHGADGGGTTDGTVPAIGGQHGSVLLKQLVDFRHDRRWDERMQHFTDRHHLATPQDLTDVAAYAASLPRWLAPGTSVGDGQNLQQGASVYFRECERCHAPLGQGDVHRLRPRLGGQHYAYLMRQIEDTASSQRPGMDRMHVERLRALSTSEREGVADYLSRVSPSLAPSRPK